MKVLVEVLMKVLVEGNRDWSAGQVVDHQRSSVTLVHAHQQLHPQGDAGVPAQRQQADVSGHDGGPQQVLHRGGSVRVPVEDLRKRDPVSVRTL